MLFFLFITAYNTRETRSWCVLNGYLVKIDGFQWFRIDFHNYRKTWILKLFEFLEKNFKRIKALYKWYLTAATVSPLKYIVCILENALFRAQQLVHIYCPFFNFFVHCRFFFFFGLFLMHFYQTIRTDGVIRLWKKFSFSVTVSGCNVKSLSGKN